MFKDDLEMYLATETLSVSSVFSLILLDKKNLYVDALFGGLALAFPLYLAWSKDVGKKISNFFGRLGDRYYKYVVELETQK